MQTQPQYYSASLTHPSEKGMVLRDMPAESLKARKTKWENRGWSFQEYPQTAPLQAAAPAINQPVNNWKAEVFASLPPKPEKKERKRKLAPVRAERKVKKSQPTNSLSVINLTHGTFHVSASEASRTLDCHHTMVARILSDKTNHKTAKGCIFRQAWPEEVAAKTYLPYYDDKGKPENRGGQNAEPVRCIETGVVYSSRRKACQAINRTESGMTEHLNGKRKTIAGLRFERVNPQIP